ncbi:hypothetical protein VW35_09385 [Devosia soli]|uniref:Uncharacterized protein n=1 Tax=Devosia soli TaxID=361041 RepID=A0A0F5L8J9_9HYPH|nr:hypothetical protein [Devosia soli]KKB78716.1 hypothetical protein VW35_09385 [Devosia soli]
MSWEIVAISVIAAMTVIWFIWSDRRARASDLNHRARHFATAPAYRHRSPGANAPAPQAYVPMGLSPSDRMFLEALAQNAKTKTDAS